MHGNTRTQIRVVLLLLLVLGFAVPTVGGVSSEDTYPVNVHRGTDISIYTDAQRGEKAYLANGDTSSTWTSLTPEDRLRFSFDFTNRVVVYGDYIHLGGEDQDGTVIDDRDVSRYQLYAKDGPDDDWTLVREVSGSVTADDTPDARHNFSAEPFTATAIRVEIIERTPGEVCSNCDVPIAEYQLLGQTVDEDFSLAPATTTTTATPTPTTTTEAPTPTTTPPTVSTPATEDDDQSLLGSGGVLLGGVGGLVILGLGGILAYRRVNDDGPDASPGTAADTVGTSPQDGGEVEEDDQSDSGEDEGPAVDASRREAPSPSDADSDVADIAPGVDAETETDEAIESESAEEEESQPDESEEEPQAEEREDETHSDETKEEPQPEEWEVESQPDEREEETHPDKSEEEAASKAADTSATAESSPAEPLESIEESLQEQLDSDEPAERIDAIEAISTRAAAGEIASTVAVDVLDHQLQADDDSDVRVAVIEALGSIGSDRAVSLLENYRLDTDTAVSKVASETLRELDT